ncbi:MAG: LruC domain-containing protein [Bacteroidia bacterium]
MNFKKITITALSLLFFLNLNAQSALYTLDCEKFATGSSASSSNNIAYDRAQCWGLGAFSYVNTSTLKINGNYSGQSNQATSLSISSSWIKSPWIKPGSANITFTHKLTANNGTLRRIVVSYIPYDANAASSFKEGTLVRFDSISYAAPLPLTNTNVSFALPAAIRNSNNPFKILISFIGTGGTSRFIVDDVFIDGIYISDPSSAFCLPVPQIQDADSDGVADADDAYPNDASRAFNSYFPSTGKGTLLFEDLWPTTGDYDFNDFVCNFRQQIVTNAANQVVELKLNLTLKAIGAGFKNGFGFQLDNLSPSKVLSVTGTNTNGASWVVNSSNGTESGQTFANIIVFDDAFKIMPSPGGSGVNVDPANPYATPVDMNITITFTTASGQAISASDISINPYLIANQERGKEIHLANYVPSSKANAALFGTGQDASNVSQSKYYKSKNNLPWALMVASEIPYPKTKVDFLQAYKKFASWAESNGSSFSDWYLNLSDYRDNTKLYTAP